MRATGDVDALLALAPDAVVYTPFAADLEEVARILESGADVASTNLFQHLGGVRGAVRARLEEACRRGGSSLLVTGVNPGWVNGLMASATAVCARVEAVSLLECADCSVYQSPHTWQALGMGERDGMTPERAAQARAWLVMFADVVERVAEALALPLERVEFFCEYGRAARRVDLGWYLLEEGSNAALRGGFRGHAFGEVRVEVTVLWYLTPHLQEEWEIFPEHYRLEVRGEPGVELRLAFHPPAHWGHEEWDTMTALPAVNALPDLCRARPGILGLRDLPPTTAPAGLWLAGAR